MLVESEPKRSKKWASKADSGVDTIRPLKVRVSLVVRSNYVADKLSGIRRMLASTCKNLMSISSTDALVENPGQLLYLSDLEFFLLRVEQLCSKVGTHNSDGRGLTRQIVQVVGQTEQSEYDGMLMM